MKTLTFQEVEVEDVSGAGALTCTEQFQISFGIEGAIGGGILGFGLGVAFGDIYAGFAC